MAGAFVRTTGPSVGLPPACEIEANTTVCRLFGLGGSYTLEVGAPGFETRAVTVNVESEERRCECPRITTRRLDVTLIPG